MTQLNTTELKEQLTALKEVLSHINHFTADQNNYFTDKNQKIDVRMKINNIKSEEYLKLKANPQSSADANELLLDILSEHVQIQYMKSVATQEYIEDIYKRFETLGKALNKPLNQLITYLESIDKEESIHD